MGVLREQQDRIVQKGGCPIKGPEIAGNALERDTIDLQRASILKRNITT
ncbi:hypothetical protein AFE_2652 [Acidithiobacillus ferrooxidans ATCC 23270]|uniref:Uncharacterized protein n=1 Tax=Acidithiobacillus ferrooxidans (strain ATCC 23270 / DSM 14882 / CIP 104768 / NCIMB 8455) TaxID=243159 RepID=B7J7W6_ACIF2|nr:hypothetical protein AFE_2652 [Acidithiobacillus ferrooxidans ATCC 23270]